MIKTAPIATQAQKDKSKDIVPTYDSEKPVRWWEAILCWALAMLVFLALTPNILDKLNPVTGDEPFYLMTAISLIQDHDLDETNNYEAKDYWQFAPTCAEMSRPHWGMNGDPPIYNVSGVLAPGLRDDCFPIPAGLPLKGLSTLPPHFSKGTKPDGNFTKHGVGLSFLIAPFYQIGGRALVVVFITMLSALLGVNIWLLAFETTGKRGVAWLTWLFMMFSAPILCYAFLIFPATPAALLVAYSWRRLRLSARARQEPDLDWQPNNAFHAIFIGLSIGVLPWLHSLYLSLSLMLFLYWLWGGRGIIFKQALKRPLGLLVPSGWSKGAIVALLIPLATLGGLFVFYYMALYGSPLPNTQDHAGFAPLYLIPVGFLGILLDQKYGLLIYAPIYLTAFAGMWLLWTKTPDPLENTARRSDLLWMTLVATPYSLLIFDYIQWWGEWCPPARYLMPVLPMLAVPLSLALSDLQHRLFKIFVGVAVAWTAGVAILFMYNPHLMYNWQDTKPARSLLWLQGNIEWLANVHLGWWLPSFVTNLDINGKEPNWPAIIAWPLLTVALVVFLIPVKGIRLKKD